MHVCVCMWVSACVYVRVYQEGEGRKKEKGDEQSSKNIRVLPYSIPDYGIGIRLE